MSMVFLVVHIGQESKRRHEDGPVAREKGRAGIWNPCRTVFDRDGSCDADISSGTLSTGRDSDGGWMDDRWIMWRKALVFNDIRLFVHISLMVMTFCAWEAGWR
jgi:hypothetical protein